MIYRMRLQPFFQTNGGASGIKRSRSGSVEKLAALPYKEFTAVPLINPDRPDDTYDYGDNGAATTQWFEDNTNFRDILSSTTDEDNYALRQYTIGFFMDGQQYKGFSKMYATEQEYTRRYDSMLDRSVVNANVKLTRSSTPELLLGGGVRTTTLSELQAMKGKTITSKANLSAAAAKVGLTIGDSSKTVEYKIHIPAGSKGAGMYIGVKGYHAWGERQREFMLNRDINFLVGDSRYDSKRGVFEVDLYFDGRNPHDYS